MYLSTPPFLCLSHHLLGFIVIFLIQYVKKSCLKIMCSIALDSLTIRLRNFLKLFSAGFVLGTAMGIISFFAAPKEKERQQAALYLTFPGRQTHLPARLLSNSTDKFIRKKPLSKEIVNKIHSGPRVGRWLSPQSTCPVSMRTRVRIPSTHKEVCDLCSLEETGRFLELGDVSA